VYVADIDEALSAAGKVPLLDDALVDFLHFGSLGWMLQRPDCERDAVHGIFPDLRGLADPLGGNPYRMEEVLSRVHVDMLISLLALNQKKCVIVDLDGTLWPGVLAETGSPFAWRPEVSGQYSFIGLYFGLHEALKMLLARGILLACVSKNDLSTVTELWRYPLTYPHDRLLSLDDFVAHRINWADKVSNITSICDELGVSLTSAVFIDDNPVERERVKQFLPEVLVAGESPFELRRWLLSDPRLQPAAITRESSARTDMLRSQAARRSLKMGAPDEETFRLSLKLEWCICKPESVEDLNRVKELFDRTTQFNTSGRRYQLAELSGILQASDGNIFMMRLRDRFGEQGVVGAAIVSRDMIESLCFSCRALGCGLEHEFLDGLLNELVPRYPDIMARLLPTPRNIPARSFYKEHGFVPQDDQVWRLTTGHSSVV
jgi:FkbH-like protein